ncbi:hypothetical protein KC19_VG187100 [Ceratodon purpureus]|nr:hypothetical protein KC19_VG187100 [Ceratodon purpureus]
MIHIGEPAQRNSGIYFQGVFLKKQKVPNGRGGFLEPADFQLGRDITIYSHTFHIVGCDVFTKRYLMKQRLPVGDEEPWPNEPLEDYRAHYLTILKPHHKEYALRQFLDLDGKVLRFFCVWDDRAVPYGERRPYVLHYFLGDDTIEILELNERNSGRMHFPMLIRRQKILKETPHDLLSQKKICGEKDFGPKESYYRDTDLHIGSYIRVFDRDLLLHDVDEFTRNYYRTKYGYSEDLLAAIDVQEDGPEFARMEIPEHNGIGSEADSLMNCIMLIPVAPQKDFIKFIYKDGKILTFTCKMVEDKDHKLHPVDKTRVMIFQYYLSDDSIQVFEPPTRNSGCVSGKYIQRIAAPRKPGTQSPYCAADCFMDQRMYLFDRIFELMEADEWTLKYMEEDPKQFPLANYEWVANKIKGAIQKLPADRSAAFNKSIKGPDPPKSPPRNDPCRQMPPASPCGNKCAQMETPPLTPRRPCSPPEAPTQSPPSWPKSPPKSPPASAAFKPLPIKDLLAQYGIHVTKQEVVTLERYVDRNKDKFSNVYALLKSYF